MDKLKRSPIWEYFDDTPDKKFIICKACSMQLKFAHGSTSIAINHLSSKHRKLHEEFREKVSLFIVRSCY